MFASTLFTTPSRGEEKLIDVHQKLIMLARAQTFNFCAVLSPLFFLAAVNEADAAWTQRAHLVAADAATDDHFGWSVAISDGLAIIGAQSDDDGADSSGSAYLFDANPRSPTFGTQLRKFSASDASANALFGRAVEIDSGLAIIGAQGSQNYRGGAYLFDVDPMSPMFGSELRKLTSTDSTPGDQFGWAVDVDGNMAIVGAIGAGRECGSFSCGAVYLFDVTHESPSFGQQLLRRTAPNAHEDNSYGRSVAIEGTKAIAVAKGGASTNFQGTAYLIDADPLSPKFGQELLTFITPGHDVAMDDHVAIFTSPTACRAGTTCSSGFGAAYVFDIDPFSPTYGNQLLELTASDGADGDWFGWSAAISEGLAIVSAVRDDLGSAYFFDVDPMSPTFGEELFKLTSPDVKVNDLFSFSAGMSRSTVILGAPAAAHFNPGTGTGAAYLFTRHLVPEPSTFALLAIALTVLAPFRGAHANSYQ